MIAVDTNILVYAHVSDLPLHEEAKKRLRALAEGNTPWAIPVFCLGEFMRVVTHARLFARPFSAGEAAEALENLFKSPTIKVLVPGERYLPLLFEAVRDAKATGNLVYDAQIAALCRESGVATLLTEDRDFARFKGFSVKHLT